MTDSLFPMVLAVDGGGTCCRLALQDGDELRVVEVGSANVSTDFDAALKTVRAGLCDLAARTGYSIDALESLPAFVGLAGVIDQKMAQKVEAALPFRRAYVVDDRPAALRGALGDRDGVIAHCGTGSFFAARIDNTVRFAGGWGPILGDPASAQWVGRRALARSLECIDGLAPASALFQALLIKFEDAAGIVRFASDASPADFGRLAPLVTEYAKAGDEMARDIVSAAGREVSRGLIGVGWKPGLPICLTGGIAAEYVEDLAAEMNASVVPPEGTPLNGAIALAHGFAKGIANEGR